MHAARLSLSAARLPVLVLLAALVVPAAPALADDQALSDARKSVEKGKAVLLDVREQDEWSAGHLAAARLIPWSSVKAKPDEAATALPKNKPVYIHCASGGRAQKAAELLKQRGIDARPLLVKYKDLVAAGFPEAKAKN